MSLFNKRIWSYQNLTKRKGINYILKKNENNFMNKSNHKIKINNSQNRQKKNIVKFITNKVNYVNVMKDNLSTF